MPRTNVCAYLQRIKCCCFVSYSKAAHVDDSLFEGDIKIASDKDEPRAREKRAARRDRRYIWTGKTIPYEISYNLSKSVVVSTFLGVKF